MLRKAFFLTIQDEDYRVEARKLDIDDSPVEHEEIEAFLRKAKTTPKPVTEAFQRVITR